MGTKLVYYVWFFNLACRVISSKLTRIYLNIGGGSVDSGTSSSSSGLSTMVGLQGEIVCCPLLV